MLNEILPELLNLLIEIGVIIDEIYEITLNEKHDGSYVLTNHSVDYCTTNQYRGNSVYLKQFYAVKSFKTNEWEEREPGCHHASFEKLTVSNLKPNWKEGLIVEEKGVGAFFKPVKL